MRTRMVLAVILLAMSFYLAPAVGVQAQGSIMSGLLSDVEAGEELQPWMGILDSRTGILIRKMRTPARYTYLIIPVDQKDIAYMRNMLCSFIYTYPNAEIPVEFRFWMLESEMGSQDFNVFSSMPASLIPSLLLTMACEQEYEIEHVTSGHIILIKPIYEEELKELEDRLKGEG